MLPGSLGAPNRQPPSTTPALARQPGLKILSGSFELLYVAPPEARARYVAQVLSFLAGRGTNFLS